MDMAETRYNYSRMTADHASPKDVALLSISYPAAFFTLIVGYAIVCSCLRFRYEKAMMRRFNYPDRASLSKMTSNDAQSILSYLMTYEFPYIYKTALQFAIFKVRARWACFRKSTIGSWHAVDIRL